MDTYDPSQAPWFDRLLGRRQEELQQALKALREGAPSVPAHEVSDFKDLATAQADTDMDQLQAHRMEAALQRVHAARRRLTEGHFGRCLACSQALDLRRLQALPEAELCVRCQSRLEPH